VDQGLSSLTYLDVGLKDRARKTEQG